MENKTIFDGAAGPFFGTDADLAAYMPRVSGRVFIMPVGVMTVARFVTLSTKNAFPGDTFEVINQDASVNTLTIQAGLETYATRSFEGFRYRLKYVFTGVFWARLEDTFRTREIRRVAPSDSNHDYAIQDGNFFVATAVAAARDWRFTNVGAVQGQTIDIFNSTSSFAINVKNHASVTIAVVKSATGSSRSARIMFDPDGTGDWVTVGLADSA